MHPLRPFGKLTTTWNTLPSLSVSESDGKIVHAHFLNCGMFVNTFALLFHQENVNVAATRLCQRAISSDHGIRQSWTL